MHETQWCDRSWESLTQAPGQQGWKSQGWPVVAIWVTQRQLPRLGKDGPRKQFPNLWAATLLCQSLRGREASSGVTAFPFSLLVSAAPSPAFAGA